MIGNNFEENKVIPSNFMPFWRSFNMNKLDQLTPQDVYKLLCTMYSVLFFSALINVLELPWECNKEPKTFWYKIYWLYQMSFIVYGVYTI